jgi:cytochrome c
MATTAVAAPPTGQQVFEQRCTVCHSLQPAPGKMGPPLAGVVPAARPGPRLASPTATR